MSTTPVPRPITEVAERSGPCARAFLVPYGNDKAKIRFELPGRRRSRPPGKLVLVSAITPTSAGEGKTTTSIGLAQGMAKLGQAMSAWRYASPRWGRPSE